MLVDPPNTQHGPVHPRRVAASRLVPDRTDADADHADADAGHADADAGHADANADVGHADAGHADASHADAGHAGAALTDGRQPRTILDRIRRWEPSPSVATLTIGGTALAYATTPIFVRHLTATGMSVIAVSFYRFLLTAAVLARFVNFAPYARPATRWGLTSGAVMGVGWIVYVNTIADADVAIAGVIQMTYPLFAVIAGWLFFANRPNRRAIIAGVVIVAAAATGLGAVGGSGLVGGGSAWLFVAPATFGFSVAILTERLGPLDPFERLGSVTIGAAAAMSPLLARLRPDELLPQTIGALGWVLAIGAVSAFIPMVAYAAAAPVIGTARTVAAGSLELPTMFAIGAIAFGEAIEVRHLVAAAMIVGAIAMSNRSRSAHVIPDDDLPGAPPKSPRLDRLRRAQRIERTMSTKRSRRSLESASLESASLESAVLESAVLEPVSLEPVVPEVRVLIETRATEPPTTRSMNRTP